MTNNFMKEIMIQENISKI